MDVLPGMSTMLPPTLSLKAGAFDPSVLTKYLTPSMPFASDATLEKVTVLLTLFAVAYLLKLVSSTVGLTVSTIMVRFSTLCLPTASVAVIVIS
jgi:hypothetical protein